MALLNAIDTRRKPFVRPSGNLRSRRACNERDDAARVWPAFVAAIGRDRRGHARAVLARRPGGVSRVRRALPTPGVRRVVAHLRPRTPRRRLGARDGGISRLEADTASGRAADGERDARAYDEANRHLAESVDVLNQKLAFVEQEKQRLEKKLSDAKTSGAERAEGHEKRGRSEFDLSRDDWAKLAKAGEVKYTLPCEQKGGWQPTAAQLDGLGLAPGDGEAIKAAYSSSSERVWATIRPLCAEVVGSEAVAEKLRRDACTHLLLDDAKSKSEGASKELMKQVGEINAGLRPPPQPGDDTPAVVQALLALTNEQHQFERDLAQTFGPDEAHRVAFDEAMCSESSHFTTSKQPPER